MPSTSKIGVLLVNLGTPDSPTVPAVRRYLREFLSDPLVIDLPALARWVLLNAVILPFRPRRSALAYQAIWTDEGSPLLVYSKALADALSIQLGESFHAVLAMRYGTPSIAQAVETLKSQGCTEWVVVPLYPQYAQSTSESSWLAVSQAVRTAYAGRREPTLYELKPFYDNPHYIQALAAVTQQSVASFEPDCMLMSYHGLPERHLAAPICNASSHCDKQRGSCPAISDKNAQCYRAHCFATSRALAEFMDLTEEQYAVSFQSRLGRTPWIGPATDAILDDLYENGVRRLAVAMPAFVADCLETLEEIGMALQDDWLSREGTAFCLVPCLNAHTQWVKELAELVCEALPVRAKEASV